MLVVIEVRQHDQKLFYAVAFVAIQPVGLVVTP